jgi:hypothetical protein
LEIQVFLSLRFIEFTLQLNTPILVRVHQGHTKFGQDTDGCRYLDLVFKNVPKNYDRIKETRLLSISFLLKRLKELKVMYKLYQPQTSADDLNVNLETRKTLLKEESDNVRLLMQSIIDELKRLKLFLV